MVKNLPASAEDVRNAGSVPGLATSPGKGYGNPLQYSCLKDPMDRGAWWATVQRFANSQTRLKRLSTPARVLGQASLSHFFPFTSKTSKAAHGSEVVLANSSWQPPNGCLWPPGTVLSAFHKSVPSIATREHPLLSDCLDEKSEAQRG